MLTLVLPSYGYQKHIYPPGQCCCGINQVCEITINIIPLTNDPSVHQGLFVVGILRFLGIHETTSN